MRAGLMRASLRAIASPTRLIRASSPSAISPPPPRPSVRALPYHQIRATPLRYSRLRYHRGMFVVGIDVGGTFTDLTAVDETTGDVRVTKVPSQPQEEALAVLAGLQALGIAGRDVRRVVHGTTVGTNAVLERRGARVVLLTTAGFRDLIEIGRTKRNIPALFVPTFVRPRPVVERRHRFEVAERLNADGSVLLPLDEASVERALEAALEVGAEALAVCLLHSYLNPAHERAVGEAAKGRCPRLPVSCSAEVVPEYREFERFSTTVLNAYLQPLM